MASNKDIDTFQAQQLVVLTQIKKGTLTIDQALAMHKATMDKSVIERVQEELAALDN